MKYAVTIITPPGYPHWAAFREVAETLHAGLQSLGHRSILTAEPLVPGYRHIILGCNLLPNYPVAVAPDAILYNLEQIRNNPEWVTGKFLDLLRRYTVWDYSPHNAAALAELGVTVRNILPIGYAKTLTRIRKRPDPDIDVLFIGSVSPRRTQVIEMMKLLGLNAVQAFDVYGEKRDALIARAKVLLNMHHYDAKVLEQVRISYYLANRCTVLSEHSAYPDEDRSFADGVVFASYFDLAARAAELCRNPSERARYAMAGFKLMKARRIEDYLKTALAAG